MNVEQELERLTAPPVKASEVRRLSREEIEQLQRDGEIKPLHEIPRHHLCGYEVAPIRWGRHGWFSSFGG